jgi:hypothetical protein
MATYITNKVRSSSIIRVTEGPLSGNNISANIALTDLATSANETVLSASIKRVLWSSNGAINIFRGGDLVLALHGNGEMRLDDYAYSISTNNTTNIEVLSPNARGTIILEVAKEATYTIPLEGVNL